MSESEDRIVGVAERVSPPHHIGFDRALEDAVAQAVAEAGWEPGEKRRFEVTLEVEIVKTNPGWVGGYIVGLR